MKIRVRPMLAIAADPVHARGVLRAGTAAGATAAAATPMSFFVTSVSKGDGGNYGGLAGADAHCQMLAQAAGRGNVKWVAYLSTQGPGAVNARDRIGHGPWYNARGTDDRRQPSRTARRHPGTGANGQPHQQEQLRSPKRAGP